MTTYRIRVDQIPVNSVLFERVEDSQTQREDLLKIEAEMALILPPKE